MKWLSFPFARFLICLAAGILLAENLYTEKNQLNGLLLIPLFLLIFMRPLRPWAMLFILGYLVQTTQHNNYDRRLPPVGEVTLLEIRKATSSYTCFEGIVRRVAQNGTWRRARRRVHVYLHDSLSFPMGTRILYSSQIVLPEKPLHDYQFDYRTFLRYRGIGGQLFLDSADIRLTGREEGFLVQRTILRQKVRQSLRQWMPDKSHAALLTGMILGLKTDLDEGTRHIYSVTGSMHVLAVSGLHVGLVFGIISAVFSLLPRYHSWMVIRFLCYLVLLIAYAALADFSPSVIRAVMFVIIYLLGRLLQRPGPLPHVLFLTAFIMLLVNPSQLFDPSFQLSFAAVFGILLFMPLFSRVFSHTKKVLDYFLKNIGMSLAVQVATLPLTLAYFQQITFTFWLSALVVVPAAFILLVLVMAMFIFQEVPWLHEPVIQITSLLLELVNTYLKILADIPGSFVQGVNIPAWLVIPVPVLWVLFRYLIERTGKVYLYAGILLLLLWMYLLSGFMVRSQRQDRLAIFQDGKHFFIGRILGKKGLLAGTADNLTWQGRIISPWFERYGVMNPDTLRTDMDRLVRRQVKIAGVNMVFSPKTDNFPKDRSVLIIQYNEINDTISVVSGRELFYETTLLHE